MCVTIKALPRDTIDFDISNFYLFTNEFWIKFEYEYSVYSFYP